MIIKIPKRIKLATHAYRIEYKANLQLLEGSCGNVNHMEQVMQFDPSTAKTQLDVAFLHEVLHIIDRQYNCKMDNETTDRLAEGLAELLTNNLGMQFDWSNIEGDK